jgi:hypothetical protein
MSIEDASPMVLEPDDYCTIVVSLELGRFPSLWDQPKIFSLDPLSFEDEDGNRISVTYRVFDVRVDGDKLLDLKGRMEWVVVGDEYPAGALDDVTARLPKQSARDELIQRTKGLRPNH